MPRSRSRSARQERNARTDLDDLLFSSPSVVPLHVAVTRVGTPPLSSHSPLTPVEKAPGCPSTRVGTPPRRRRTPRPPANPPHPALRRPNPSPPAQRRPNPSPPAQRRPNPSLGAQRRPNPSPRAQRRPNPSRRAQRRSPRADPVLVKLKTCQRGIRRLERRLDDVFQMVEQIYNALSHEVEHVEHD